VSELNNVSQIPKQTDTNKVSKLPKRTILQSFQQNIDDASVTFTFEQAVLFGSKAIAAEHTIRPKIVELISNKYGISDAEVNKQLDIQEELRTETFQFEEALNYLAPTVAADYSLEEILPPHIAEVVAKSCTLSDSDWKNAVFLLLAVTSGLTGNKAICVSPVSDLPISLSLLVLNCGDSSSTKDRTSRKIIAPIQGFTKHLKNKRQKALLEATKISDANDRKAEEYRLEHNLEEVLYQSMTFSAEALVLDATKRAPSHGFHIHQAEGSDFLACERWGSGQGQNTQGPGLLRKSLMEAWDGPLESEYNRTSADKSTSFRGQSMSLTLNCQMRFVPLIVDFDEDSLGWTSRILVVLAEKVGTNKAKRVRGSVDPLTEFVIKRLIPFTQAIQLRNSNQLSPTGFMMNNVQLELDEYDGAEDRYRDFCQLAENEVTIGEEAGTEPAYMSFLKKTPVRIMKFAALLHILNTIEGKQIPSVGVDDSYEIFRPSCDPNFELTKNGGITLETFERAIKLELIARNQYQVIADLCRTAPARRDERKAVGQKLTTADRLLEKLERYGEINERVFKDRVKSKNNSRPEIGACIEQLVTEGKIIRTDNPETKGSATLSFARGVRN